MNNLLKKQNERGQHKKSALEEEKEKLSNQNTLTENNDRVWFNIVAD